MHEKYLQNIGQYEILTPEEEREIAVKMRNGDKAVREILINSNLRFVVSVAKKYSNGENLTDLVQAGNIGLIQGIDRYNPDKGFRITTYANFWIVKEILDYYKQNRGMRLTPRLRGLIKKSEGVIRKMSAKNGEIPSADEIAVILGPEYSGDDIRDALKADRVSKPLSLNNKSGEDGDIELIDTIGMDSGETLISEISSRKTIELIRTAILVSILREDLRLILSGILLDGKTFSEIADKMGTTKSVVKEKYKIGIRILKKTPEIKKIAPEK